MAHAKTTPLSKRITISATIATALLSGYGSRQAFAGNCVSGGGPFYCSDPANPVTDITQVLVGTPLKVVVDNGFGLDRSGFGKGNAFDLETTGSELTFTDDFSSNISAELYGIKARNNGTGATTITSTGVITAGRGIDARNGTDATDIIISTNEVETDIGGGVYTLNQGSGESQITNTGGVDAKGYGVYARTSATAKGITIEAVGINSTQSDGVKVLGYGLDADINVTVTGAIVAIGGGGSGLYIDNKSNTNNIVIETAAVSGQRFGIESRNRGKGDTSITSTGAVTGVDYRGIYAFNGASAKKITIDVASVTGEYDAINTTNQGSGDTKITSTGDVTGGSGIKATSEKGSITIDGTNSNITANSGHGVEASISATGTGDITVIPGGDLLSIGVDKGIIADNAGSGNNIITISHGLDPETGVGIESNTMAGSLSSISILSGADAEGGVVNNEGNSTVIIEGGGALSGDIELGDGNDVLLFRGGDFSNITLFDGGDDTSGTTDGFTDELGFWSVNGVIPAANMVNWERIQIGSGLLSSISTMRFTGSTLSAGTLSARVGSTFSLQDTTANEFTIEGAFAGENGSFLALDVQLDDGAPAVSDLLVVEGKNWPGDTTVLINNIGGSGGLTMGDGIKLVQVDGVSDGVFSLASPIVEGDYVYDLAKVGKDWYLQSCELGDADKNGVVDVRDIVKSINMALGNEAAMACADFDQPANGVTISDVLATVNKTLGN